MVLVLYSQLCDTEYFEFEYVQIPMWLELASRLMPNGRLMVNCAGIETEVKNGKPELVLDDLAWMLNSTVKILSEAFPGQVSNTFHLHILLLTTRLR